MTDDALKHVVIVGGGTAGWLTACILAADHRAAHEDGLRVTLVESPTIPILGVGEGTWPSLRDTLKRIGIGETEFVRKCEASFKQGSRFNGWVTGAPDDFYFHPFEAPPSADDLDPLALWRAAPVGTPFGAAVGYQPALCAAGRAPKQIVTPEFAAVANYAYHLDAPAFAKLLCDHGRDNLGVRHIVDDVVSVEREETGDVAKLETKERGAITGDLFIDCTGIRALLIGEALGVDATDVSDILFNDRALAVQAPCGDKDPIASQTTGTALSAGWVWDIGLQTRRGIGYVFSSRHTSEEVAREALTDYLEATAAGSGRTGDDARLIAFQSTYRETSWRRNVVAVGMSQGFVEPLEASAIVMIELSAAMISDILPTRGDAMDAAARRFNERFAYRWARIVDFLKLHYVLNQRPERYWADHRDDASWTDRLRSLMDQWQYGPPSREDFPQALEIFPAASYAYVLYGMGFETAPRGTRRRKDLKDRAMKHAGDLAANQNKLLAGLPSNRELVDHINSRGLTKV